MAVPAAGPRAGAPAERAAAGTVGGLTRGNGRRRRSVAGGRVRPLAGRPGRRRPPRRTGRTSRRSSTGPPEPDCAGPAGVERLLLRRYLAYLGTRRYARSSVARKAAALRAYFRWCRQTGLVDARPGPAALGAVRARPVAAGAQPAGRRPPARCRPPDRPRRSVGRRGRPPRRRGPRAALRGRPARRRALRPRPGRRRPGRADGDRRRQGGQGTPRPGARALRGGARPLARRGPGPPRPAADARRRPSS